MGSLWGGMLTGVVFDPTTHTCMLNALVLDTGTASTHLVECKSVKELRFFSEIPEPWTYAELTELHAEFDRTAGCWRLELMLWSEDAGLFIRCTDLYFDGQIVSTSLGAADGLDGPGAAAT